MTYTPTTEQVREGFAQDPVAEYYNPLINHAQYGRKAFDRWLEAHDREVAAKAWQEGYADCMDYHMSNGLKGAEANPYKEEA